MTVTGGENRGPEPAANATVTAEALNVRSEPGVAAGIVAVLGQGARVEIIGGPEEADGFTWLEISTADGIHGWVAAEFLLGD